jgi:hypothetical protein
MLLNFLLRCRACLSMEPQARVARLRCYRSWLRAVCAPGILPAERAKLGYCAEAAKMIPRSPHSGMLDQTIRKALS